VIGDRVLRPPREGRKHILGRIAGDARHRLASFGDPAAMLTARWNS
jgi:hypothetical protein